eukprot:5576626-Alexandrium_andersonii.AAC.1
MRVGLGPLGLGDAGFPTVILPSSLPLGLPAVALERPAEPGHRLRACDQHGLLPVGDAVHVLQARLAL